MPSGLTLDTAGGNDTVNAPMSGQTRTVHLTDSGSTTGDVLNVLGTPGKDTILSRASTASMAALPTQGFVAKRLAPGVMDPQGFGELLTPIFSVLIVFVLAEVFREGARLRRESELTI